MKNWPPDVTRFLAISLTIALIGGAALLLTAMKLQTDRAELQSITQKLQKNKEMCALATTRNLVRSQENEKQTQFAVEDIEAVLKRSSAPFAMAQDLKPDDWKWMLQKKLRQLNQSAQSCELEEEFYFGFDEFSFDTPTAKQTFSLGIQLLAVEELCRALFDSEISKLSGVSRLEVDEVPLKKAKNSQLFPFELKFCCRPEALRRFLNQLLHSRLLFVPRKLEIRNPNDPNHALWRVRESKEDKPLFILSGDEDLHVLLQVDLLVWNEGREE